MTISILATGEVRLNGVGTGVFFGGKDRDFNDFVVLVESVNPVPEPGTLALLGLGLAGLGAARRRKA